MEPKIFIEKASDPARVVVGSVVLSLVGLILSGSPVGFQEGISDGIIDPLGAPVGEVGVAEGGVVDGKPEGGTDGISVVSERHLTSVSYSLHVGEKASN
jgi:hypothetical protein